MEDWEVVVVLLVIWVGGMALDDKDLYSSGQQQQYPHSEIMFLKHCSATTELLLSGAEAQLPNNFTATEPGCSHRW